MSDILARSDLDTGGASDAFEVPLVLLFFVNESNSLQSVSCYIYLTLILT